MSDNFNNSSNGSDGGSGEGDERHHVGFYPQLANWARKNPPRDTDFSPIPLSNGDGERPYDYMVDDMNVRAVKKSFAELVNGCLDSSAFHQSKIGNCWLINALKRICDMPWAALFLQNIVSFENGCFIMQRYTADFSERTARYYSSDFASRKIRSEGVERTTNFVESDEDFYKALVYGLSRLLLPSLLQDKIKLGAFDDEDTSSHPRDTAELSIGYYNSDILKFLLRNFAKKTDEITVNKLSEGNPEQFIDTFANSECFKDDVILKTHDLLLKLHRSPSKYVVLCSFYEEREVDPIPGCSFKSNTLRTKHAYGIKSYCPDRKVVTMCDPNYSSVQMHVALNDFFAAYPQINYAEIDDRMLDANPASISKVVPVMLEENKVVRLSSFGLNMNYSSNADFVFPYSPAMTLTRDRSLGVYTFLPLKGEVFPYDVERGTFLKACSDSSGEIISRTFSTVFDNSFNPIETSIFSFDESGREDLFVRHYSGYLIVNSGREMFSVKHAHSKWCYNSEYRHELNPSGMDVFVPLSFNYFGYFVSKQFSIYQVQGNSERMILAFDDNVLPLHKNQSCFVSLDEDDVRISRRIPDSYSNKTMGFKLLWEWDSLKVVPLNANLQVFQQRFL